MEETNNLEKTPGDVPVLENLVRRILTREEDWDVINSIIASIHSNLRKACRVKMKGHKANSFCDVMPYGSSMGHGTSRR